MEVNEARRHKLNLEVEIYKMLTTFETETGLQVAAVLIERVDLTTMGDDSFKSQLNSVEVVAGIDIPAPSKGGIE